MFHRTWIPTPYESSTAETKIEIYDAGVYCGEMIDGVWTCWEIQSRVMNDKGCIEEVLKAMPEDWAPFDSIKREVYLGAALTRPQGFQLRGWTVLTEPAQVLNYKFQDCLGPAQEQRQPQVQAQAQPQAQVQAQAQAEPQVQAQEQPQASKIQAVRPPPSRHNDYTRPQGARILSQQSNHSSRILQGQKQQVPALTSDQANLKTTTSQQGEKHQKDLQQAEKASQSIYCKDKSPKQFWIPLVQAVQISP